MNTAATRPAQPIKLYGNAISGHVHRVRLFLSMLDLPFELIELDLRQRANRTPEFLARNPFGQVPVIEDGEVTLPDSNAILVYLNERYAADPARWMPPTRWARRACSAGSRWRRARWPTVRRPRGSWRCSVWPPIRPRR